VKLENIERRNEAIENQLKRNGGNAAAATGGWRSQRAAASRRRQRKTPKSGAWLKKKQAKKIIEKYMANKQRGVSRRRGLNINHQ